MTVAGRGSGVGGRHRYLPPTPGSFVLNGDIRRSCALDRDHLLLQHEDDERDQDPDGHTGELRWRAEHRLQFCPDGILRSSPSPASRLSAASTA